MAPTANEMMARVTSEELIREFIRRLDAEDVDGALALFVDDCSYSSAFDECEAHGKAELDSLLRSHRDGWSERRVQATSILVEGETAASELRLEGVTTDGRAVSLDSVGVWDFADGRIRRLRIYGDTAPLLAASR